MNEEIKTLGIHDNVLGTEEKDDFSAAKILNEEKANQIRRVCSAFSRKSPTFCLLL